MQRRRKENVLNRVRASVGLDSWLRGPHFSSTFWDRNFVFVFSFLFSILKKKTTIYVYLGDCVFNWQACNL